MSQDDRGQTFRCSGQHYCFLLVSTPIIIYTQRPFILIESLCFSSVLPDICQDSTLKDTARLPVSFHVLLIHLTLDKVLLNKVISKIDEWGIYCCRTLLMLWSIEVFAQSGPEVY